MINPQLASRDAVAPGAAGRFTGAVQIASIVEREGGPALHVYEVFFDAGARTVWHEHEGEQILVGLTGTCFVQLDGQSARALAAGEAIRIAAGIRHWHGAGAAAPASHLGLNEALPTSWGEPVAEDAYRRAVAQAMDTVRV